MAMAKYKCPYCGAILGPIAVNESGSPRTIHTSCKKCHKPIVVETNKGKAKAHK